jgi:DNA polymerase V
MAGCRRRNCEAEAAISVGTLSKPEVLEETFRYRSIPATVVLGKDLATALSEFINRAAEKQRRQQQHHVHTNHPFCARDAQYSRSVTVPFVRPDSGTAVLVNAALVGLRLLYRTGFL